MGFLAEEPKSKLSEQLPPLTDHAAAVEADRCLYCYDAPCSHACPTHIDIPGFIKKIASDNLRGSARVIFDSNLLGATCARVCPVQELCEGACVLGSEHKPITIGRLQRHAMDFAYRNNIKPARKSSATGCRVAVIGAGPAGLSCAGELARRGHHATIFEKRTLSGGLSTYGIIALREPIGVALAEVKMIEAMGVTIRGHCEFQKDISMSELQQDFDAIVLSGGLGRTPGLAIEGEDAIIDGLEFIEASKIAPETLQAARRVLVIGAGNTAIDCATIARRIGAEQVTVLYRRTEREMTCYPHEYHFAREEGIQFQFLTQPLRLLQNESGTMDLECLRVKLGRDDSSGRPAPMAIAGSEFVLPADQVIKAIGQQKSSLAELLGLRTHNGFVAVGENFETSIEAVYAVGDCIRSKGAASTVMAVQDGKLAAAAIDRKFRMQPSDLGVS